MRIARRQPLELLTISALDIFASSLGVFVLISILMFPYYLKQPSLEAEQAGARAELAAAGDAVEERARSLAAAEERRAAAETALAAARERLEQAESAAAAARPSPEPESRSALAIADLDLVFVLDTTGSMRQEIADLQASLIGIVRVLARLAGSLRVGLVAFKDQGEEYLTRALPLSPMTGGNAAALVDFVGRLSAQGGGDDPEPVDEALRVALAMPWRAEAKGQIIVIGDAPAHAHRQGAALDLAESFRRDAKAPRTVSAILTGGNPESRAFLERLAAAGGGGLALHQGQMIESVLLSVLGGGAGRSAAP
jgi:multidrug efflux pump subunit AcrA (membrane-fusion protein)